MRPSRTDAAAAARLARLSLAPDELDALARDLAAVLARIDELRHVAGAEPNGDVPAFLRADEPGADPLCEPPATFAPEWRGGWFTVPRIPVPPRDG